MPKGPPNLAPRTRTKLQTTNSYAPTVRTLWNAIRQGLKPHILRCGCINKPGEYYHSVGVLIDGRFSYTKQHPDGLCIEPLAGPKTRH